MRAVMLDDELAALLEGDRPLDEATREVLVMGLLRRGRISTGKACELLNLDRTAFLQRAKEHNVPVYLTSEREWEADLAALEAWHDQAS